MGASALPYQIVAAMNTNQTTENFLKVMQDFHWPEPRPISYRLYHDETGRPLVYTMEDLPGTFVEIDQQTYIAASHWVKVVDGKLIKIESKSLPRKLRPSQQDGVCCDPRDVCVIVTHNTPNQRWRYDSNDQD